MNENQKSTNGLAIAGLVLSLLGGVCGIIGGWTVATAILGLPIAIVGLVLSCVGGKKAVQQTGRKSGIATAGLVVGIIAVVFTAIVFCTCGLCYLSAGTANVVDELNEPKADDYSVDEPIIYTWNDSINYEHVQIIAPITNTGSRNLYLKSGSIELIASDGSLIDNYSYVDAYPQILAPGETGYYYVTRSSSDGYGDNLSAVVHVEVDIATVPLVRFNVTDVTFKNDDFTGLQATGRIHNDTNNDESLPKVVVIPMDSNGTPLCVLEDYTDSVNAGDSMGFSASDLGIPDIDASEVASYAAYSYPNQIQI